MYFLMPAPSAPLPPSCRRCPLSRPRHPPPSPRLPLGRILVSLLSCTGRPCGPAAPRAPSPLHKQPSLGDGDAQPGPREGRPGLLPPLPWTWLCGSGRVVAGGLWFSAAPRDPHARRRGWAGTRLPAAVGPAPAPERGGGGLGLILQGLGGVAWGAPDPTPGLGADSSWKALRRYHVALAAADAGGPDEPRRLAGPGLRERGGPRGQPHPA